MLELLLLLADLTTPTSTLAATAVEQPRLQSIVLYYSPRCPHSQKVLAYVNKTQLLISLKNVTTNIEEAKEQLKQIGGHAIVPCLVVNGRALYNDSDIITWLTDHADQLPKKP